MVVSAFILPLILVPDNYAWLLLIFPFISLLQGMNQPNTSAIISNLSGEDKQGEISGINQSLQSAAQAIPSLIAGLVSSININLPTILAAACTIFAWCVFILFYSGKQVTSSKY
jgi:DHA1 family tetracycline resistance protein-like MFS transporter